MPETTHFVNFGFGWACRRCREEGGAARAGNEGGGGRARFFSEGEAEERGEPRLASGSLARWRDESRRTLYCPRCGVEETLENLPGA